MANTDKIKGISLDITLETREFKNSLSELRREVKLAQNNVESLRHTLEDNQGDPKVLKDYMEAVDDFDKKLDVFKTNVKATFNELSGSNVDYKAEKLAAVNKELRSADGYFSKAATSAREYGNQVAFSQGNLTHLAPILNEISNAVDNEVKLLGTSLSPVLTEIGMKVKEAEMPLIEFGGTIRKNYVDISESVGFLKKEISILADVFNRDKASISSYNDLLSTLRERYATLENTASDLRAEIKRTETKSEQWYQLQEALTQVDSEMDRTLDQIKNLEAAFDDNSVSIEMSSETFAKVAAAANKYGNEIDYAGDETEETTDIVGELGDSFGEAGEGASLLGTIIKGNLISDAIKAGLKEVVKLVKEFAGFYKDFMKQGIEYNASMETYTTTIRAMLDGDEEAANGVVSAMKAINKESAFSNSALLESAQQLIASDISAEDATKSITDLAKALAYAGKGDDELKRMAQNLNQIKNAGKAVATDLKQFAYAGVPIYKLLAEYDEIRFGNGVDSKEDPATFEDIANALAKATEEGGKFADAFEMQAGTYNFELNRIKSNWLELSGVISQDVTSALASDLFPAVNETLGAMKTGFQEDGVQGMMEAFSQGLSDLAPIILEKSPELLQDGIDIIEGIVDGLLQEDEEGKTVLESAVEELVEILTEWSLDPDTWVKLFDIGWNLAKGIAKGFWKGLVNIFKDNPELSEAFSGSFGSIGSDIYNSGGFGAVNSPTQSGGFSNQITLNASFVANGNLDEAQALRFADIISDRINENLGQQI